MAKLIPHIFIWAVLATVVIFLALYRRRLNHKVDELLHVLDAEAPLIGTQAEVAKKIDKVDLWGKTLTVLATLYGLALVGYYIYTVFADTSVKMN